MSGKYSWFGITVVWLLLVPVYLAFAVNLGYRELAVSVVAAGIATLGAIVYARQRKIAFRFRVAFLIPAARVPLVMVTDTRLLLVQVARRLLGHIPASLIVTVEFDCGEGRSSEAGRRALAVTFLTLTPNTVVLDICPDEPELVYHELTPAPLPGFAREMGAIP